MSTVLTEDLVSILTVDLQVSNVPNEEIITDKDNQCEYTERYYREEGGMKVSNLDVNFTMLDSNEDGTGKLTISKTFDDAVTEQEALIWLNGLSTISLVDLEELKELEVEVLEVGEYDYM